MYMAAKRAHELFQSFTVSGAERDKKLLLEAACTLRVRSGTCLLPLHLVWQVLEFEKYVPDITYNDDVFWVLCAAYGPAWLGIDLLEIQSTDGLRSPPQHVYTEFLKVHNITTPNCGDTGFINIEFPDHALPYVAQLQHQLRHQRLELDDVTDMLYAKTQEYDRCKSDLLKLAMALDETSASMKRAVVELDTQYM